MTATQNARHVSVAREASPASRKIAVIRLRQHRHCTSPGVDVAEQLVGFLAPADVIEQRGQGDPVEQEVGGQLVRPGDGREGHLGRQPQAPQVVRHSEVASVMERVAADQLAADLQGGPVLA